jgi:hypothetical protein
LIRFDLRTLVGAAAIVVCLTGEFVARPDDWQFAGIPFQPNLSHDALRARVETVGVSVRTRIDL